LIKCFLKLFWGIERRDIINNSSQLKTIPNKNTIKVWNEMKEMHQAAFRKVL
jgi:hypothetical protein